jgi:hypothetical protein
MLGEMALCLVSGLATERSSCTGEHPKSRHEGKELTFMVYGHTSTALCMNSSGQHSPSLLAQQLS